MKCIFTQQETQNKTHNFPVSREGRTLDQEKRIVMAEARLEQHKKLITEMNEKREEMMKESGEVFIPLKAETTIDKFIPSIKEVCREQVRQNNLPVETEETTTDE